MRGKVTGITLDYKRLNSFPLLSTLTFSDARWMIRMIAQLTPSQIMRSFKNAGFPDLVSQIFVLKLMSRRNQLIEALNLGEEIAKEDGWKGSIAGHEKFFTKEGIIYS